MKTAPQTAQIPPVTREVIAIWEKELDDFVIDIQKRLENIAVSISAKLEFSVPHHDAMETQQDFAPVDVDMPPPSDALEHEQSVVQDQSAVQDETDDRLQAIKQKLAARLQGEET